MGLGLGHRPVRGEIDPPRPGRSPKRPGRAKTGSDGAETGWIRNRDRIEILEDKAPAAPKGDGRGEWKMREAVPKRPRSRQATGRGANAFWCG